jgi:hypothetical protein
MLSFFSRCQNKRYPHLYLSKKYNLQDYIRKIESDLKNNNSIVGYTHPTTDMNYGILPIVGIVYFFYNLLQPFTTFYNRLQPFTTLNKYIIM